MKETALITGASGGLGREFAKLFAENGYNLVITGRREDKLKSLAGVLKPYDISCDIIVKDLSDPKAPKELFDELKQKNIHIDVLVNNAGFGVSGSFAEADIEKQLAMIQTNIASLTHLTKLAIDEMNKKGKGKILNIGSTGSFAPCPSIAVYCATKAYVLSFSEAIAYELEGTGITVTALCPGPTETGFAEAAGVVNAKSFKSGVMKAADAAKVGYEALMKKQPMVVAGLQNKLLTQSIRFSPRGLVTRISAFIMNPN
ncbi:MAG TPA: SDR family oxidoreductase [Ignavibacteriales bacterium]|nr:SDR family oxidoreductase [Ignavibacteriales bacterium]